MGIDKNTDAAQPARDMTRQDWLIAALRALADGGVEAVRVERLAIALGVSKGSFYWHFKDRAELLSALFALWSDDFTQQLIDHVAALQSPADRLRALGAAALTPTIYGVDSARAESSAQAWAWRDAYAAATLRQVDAKRLEYLTSELVAAGLPPASARQFGKILYLALLGLYSARNYNPDLADDNAYLALIDLILGSAGER